jgi:hypothetical protein
VSNEIDMRGEHLWINEALSFLCVSAVNAS